MDAEEELGWHWRIFKSVSRDLSFTAIEGTYNWFIKAIDGMLYGFTVVINPLGVLGEHSKNL